MVLDMGYWTKVIRKIIWLVIALIAVLLGLKLALFYTPFLIGFIISLLIEPIVRYITKKTNMTRRTSSIIILLIIFSILIGLVVFGAITVITESSNLLQSLNIYIEKISNQIEYYIGSLHFDNINIPKQVISMIETGAGDFLQVIGRGITSFLTSILQGITKVPIMVIYVIITILSTYFICADKLYILDQLEHHFPKLWVKRLSSHVKEIAGTLRKLFKSPSNTYINIIYYSFNWAIFFKIYRLKHTIPIFIGRSEYYL